MASKTLTVDTTKKTSSSYSLKGKDTLVIKTQGGGEFLEGIKSVSASGTTISVNIMGKTVKFTNASNVDTFKIKAYSVSGAAYYYDKTLSEFYTELNGAGKWAVSVKKKTVNGSVFNEVFSYSGYTESGLTINAGSGADVIRGTAYNDTLKGDAGDDKLYGNDGNDKIYGGNGNDFLEGGAGNDTLIGGKGDNIYRIYNYYGGKNHGNDTIKFTKGENANIEISYWNEEDVDNIAYTLDGKGNAQISFGEGDYAITTTLKGFAGKKLVKSLNQKYLASGESKDLLYREWTYKANKNYKGSYLNEIIDASGYVSSKTKGLTLNGGAGDDTIIGSVRNDKINGGAGADYITGGKGNDTLTGGKSYDCFIFHKNDGVDTITDATVDDWITLCDDEILANGGKDLRFVKKGKNLEVYYSSKLDSKNKIVIKNHFKTKAAKRIESFIISNTANDTDEETVFVDLKFPPLLINGTKKADTLKGFTGDDEIYGYAGNDKITGGKGNDFINAGKGKNNIIYNLGDGDDIIEYGGGTDTLVFDKGTKVSAVYDGDDLLVTYSGKKGNTDYSNTITVDDYFNKKSVKYVKIGNTTKAISKYIAKDTGAVTHIKSTDIHKTFNLATGNNTVVFDDAPEFGYDNLLVSQNTAGNGYTDTIYMNGVSFTDNTLLIYGVNEGEGYNDKLWLDATAFPECPGDGEILYNDFYKPTAANVVIRDKDRSYTATGYNSAQELDLTDDTKNRVIAIKAEAGTSTITSNENYNVINTFGGASLDYTYGGGHDNVTSLEWDVDDTYTVALTDDTSLNINDFGGTNTLIVTELDRDDARLMFNVNKNSWTNEWQYDSGCIVLTTENNLKKSTLAATTTSNATLTGGINIRADFEGVTVGGENVDIGSWGDYIMNDVVAWLENSAHAYDSVADALAGCEDKTAIAQLVACYSTSYNAIV
ncbi:MAG: hypothetical protein K6A44_02045 [bacterium]|nr:hypothetical protein [bacterium]